MDNGNGMAFKNKGFGIEKTRHHPLHPLRIWEGSSQYSQFVVSTVDIVSI
jgi:hypothetical protein